ncbi:MAG: hypothetical protein LBQ22_12115 [Bacteroidales bacterium]|jgi:predicted transcriptional regulator|nr:hypothetical protein [Bacteroidales bacterium]
MSTDVLLSKCYVKEVVNDYYDIVSRVNEILAQTGYEGKIVAQKLGIPESAFYRKKRRKSFSLKEMMQIVELMNEDGKDIENEYFKRIYEERKDGKNITLDGLETVI